MTTANTDNRLELLIVQLLGSIQPSRSNIEFSVATLRTQQTQLSDSALADVWAERVCRRYAAGGALTALPSVVPGLGTSVQLAVEGGTIVADLGYMLHCMADIVMGVGHIFGRDIEHPFDEEFVRVVAIWCGALSISKEAVVRLGTKLAVAQVKRVPKELLIRLNRKIGKNLLSTLGLRRGGVTLGRLLPFGFGALVGGGFNYATMRSFKATTIEYFATMN